MIRSVLCSLGVVAAGSIPSAVASADGGTPLEIVGSPAAYTYVSASDRGDDGAYRFRYVGVYMTLLSERGSGRFTRAQRRSATLRATDVTASERQGLESADGRRGGCFHALLHVATDRTRLGAKGPGDRIRVTLQVGSERVRTTLRLQRRNLDGSTRPELDRIRAAGCKRGTTEPPPSRP